MSAVAKNPRPALNMSIPLARTDYEAIQGVQPNSIDPNYYDATNRFSVMHRNSVNRFASIYDGSSSTVMVVEAAGRPMVYRRGTRRGPAACESRVRGAAQERNHRGARGAIGHARCIRTLVALSRPLGRSAQASPVAERPAHRRRTRAGNQLRARLAKIEGTGDNPLTPAPVFFYFQPLSWIQAAQNPAWADTI